MIREAAHDLKNTTSSIKHCGAHGVVRAWTGSLVFIDDVPTDRSGRINCEVYEALLPARIQPNAAKLFNPKLKPKSLTGK